MPHSFGYRARTRSMFSRDFRKKGVIPLSNYLRVYKLGDFVDIKANAAIHKGMPHKYYHGRTGRIFDLTKTSVGVEVNKVVRNRQLKKRIHIRVEHVRPSKCRQEFLNRRAENEKHKKLVRAGQAAPKPLKRQPAQPRPGFILKARTTPELLHPLPYEILA